MLFRSGLNEDAVMTLAEKSGNPRFAWDSYRRFIQMYGDVVLGMKPKNKTDIDPFEEIIEAAKKMKGVELDNELGVEDMKMLVPLFKKAVKDVTGRDFPASPWDQLWGAISAVFDSWMNERAIYYRRINQIPEEWGTAVNVQAMVFGNMGDTSATGVAFTRDAATGATKIKEDYHTLRKTTHVDCPTVPSLQPFLCVMAVLSLSYSVTLHSAS